jgi:hypothetical protein
LGEGAETGAAPLGAKALLSISADTGAAEAAADLI